MIVLSSFVFHEHIEVNPLPQLIPLHKNCINSSPSFHLLSYPHKTVQVPMQHSTSLLDLARTDSRIVFSKMSSLRVSSAMPIACLYLWSSKHRWNILFTIPSSLSSTGFFSPSGSSAFSTHCLV